MYVSYTVQPTYLLHWLRVVVAALNSFKMAADSSFLHITYTGGGGNLLYAHSSYSQ